MLPIKLQDALQRAVTLHRDGRLADAETLYRQVLAAEPQQPEALHHLGLIAQKVGRQEIAVGLIRQAIALRPSYAEAHNNLGNILKDSGNLDEAIAAFREATTRKTTLPEAHYNLATALYEKGQLKDAIAAFRQALALSPNYPEAHAGLATVLHQQGKFGEAIASFRQAVALRPNDAEAQCNLGVALQATGQLNEAITAYRKAVTLNPAVPEAHSNLANALKDNGQLHEAIASCRRAIALRPDYPEAHCSLGNALKATGQLDEAIAAFHRAIDLRPDLAEAHCNLGIALKDQGRTDEALAALHRAIDLRPDLAEAHNDLGNVLLGQGHHDAALAAYRRAAELDPHCSTFQWNISNVLLLQGDFERGWPLFESRWEDVDLKGSKRNFPQPLWQGEALHGRRILLHAEQGLGDTLQFIRYAPLVAARGGHVIVECQPALKTLLATAEGIAEIIEQGEPIPAFELHCPMMSLPLALGTRVETIPATTPYLQADATRTARWRKKLEHAPSVPSTHPLKVGLVWAGGDRHHQPRQRPADHRRSMRLHQFAPLAKVPGVIFVSLQKGAPATQAKTPPEGMPLLDWTDELIDFADTAALVETLDLVVSVDTAVAHLAAALGKPVWLLNRFDSCWRWLLHRTDSPWYPTLRLFRQPKAGDWESVIASVSTQLQTLAQGH